MQLEQYLDSTYLKTPTQALISEKETSLKITQLVQEAIDYGFKLVMIRPDYVAQAYTQLQMAQSEVLLGTVIDFHLGDGGLSLKLKEAQKAIELKADELDFVINYKAYLSGNLDLVKTEVLACTKLCLDHNKTIKWIIEIAALNNSQIIGLTKLIKDLVLKNFSAKKAKKVFIKSSTGFFNTQDAKPNGATIEGMQLILQNAHPLKVKASGGIKTLEDALKMINLGVDRIGTSSAKQIADQAIKNKIEL